MNQTKDYITLSLNCFLPHTSASGWQTAWVRVPKGTSFAELADLVGSTNVCEYDYLREQVALRGGWCRDPQRTVRPPQFSYHVNITPNVLNWLRDHRDVILDQPIRQLMAQEE